MKAKYLVGLVAAIILTAAGALAALAQEPAPPAPPGDVEPFEQNFSFFVDGGGFLGVYAENINRENMARYHLNQVRGVGVVMAHPITRVVHALLIARDEQPERRGVAGLRSDAYWLDAPFDDGVGLSAWYFSTAVGVQGGSNQGNPLFAWAVHDGDITSPAPEPATWGLMLGGLGIVAGDRHADACTVDERVREVCRTHGVERFHEAGTR